MEKCGLVVLIMANITFAGSKPEEREKKIAALVSFIWSEVPANWLLLQRVAGVKWAADSHRLIY